LATLAPAAMASRPNTGRESKGIINVVAF